MNGETIISLSPEDAALFVEFRRMQDVWLKLVNSGALKIKGGNVTLHFDGNGDLRQIDRRDTLLRI